MLKQWINKLTPPEIKSLVKYYQQDFVSKIKLQQKTWVKKGFHHWEKRLKTGQDFPNQIQLVQPIKENRFSNNKIHNILLAVENFNNRAIFPGETFSFWKLVGQPSQKKGYRKGRSLLNETLTAETGGGLCQLSGILYHLALLGGLEISERHSHSQDLYNEQTRYAPLGSDATVCYGYKDLKIKNSLKTPISFRIHLNQNNIKGYLCANEVIPENQIDFQVEKKDKKILVTTIRNGPSGQSEKLGVSIYTPYKGQPL